MKQELQAVLKEAMKAKDKVRLETIRALISAITYEEIEKKIEPLPREQALPIFQREIKKRKEELEYAEQAKRSDLIEKLKLEISVIEGFLPKQLSEIELEKYIGDLKAQNPEINLGMVMKSLKDSFAGQYDSKLASDIAKRLCS